MSAPLVSPASSMRRSAAVTALAVLLAGHAGAQSTDVFRTKRFVEQISADPFAGAAGSEADTQVEPHIALDPNDPSIVVAVVQQGRFDTNGGSVDPGLAASHDGGRSWTAGNLPGLTVAVGGAPVLVQDDSTCTLFNDKTWIAVDTFPASPHVGRVYAAWDRIDSAAGAAPTLLRFSDDRGATWSGLVTVSDPTALTVGALPLVQPNGDV